MGLCREHLVCHCELQSKAPARRNEMEQAVLSLTQTAVRAKPLPGLGSLKDTLKEAGTVPEHSVMPRCRVDVAQLWKGLQTQSHKWRQLLLGIHTHISGRGQSLPRSGCKTLAQGTTDLGIQNHCSILNSSVSSFGFPLTAKRGWLDEEHFI